LCAQDTMFKSKAVPDTDTEMTPLMHRSSNDGVIRLSPLSSYVVLEVVEISHACFVHLVSQYSPHTLVNWI